MAAGLEGDQAVLSHLAQLALGHDVGALGQGPKRRAVHVGPSGEELAVGRCTLTRRRGTRPRRRRRQLIGRRRVTGRDGRVGPLAGAPCWPAKRLLPPYRHSSSTQAGGKYKLKASIVWHLSWAASTSPDPQAMQVRGPSGQRDVRVAEAQGINTDRGPPTGWAVLAAAASMPPTSLRATTSTRRRRAKNALATSSRRRRARSRTPARSWWATWSGRPRRWPSCFDGWGATCTKCRCNGRTRRGPNRVDSGYYPAVVTRRRVVGVGP